MIPIPELKAHLRIRPTTTEQDKLLERLEADAVAVAEHMTRRYFGLTATVTEYVDGTGTQNLWLSDDAQATPLPVVSERSQPGGTATSILGTADDGWLLRGGRLVRKAGLIWSLGFEYQVDYSRGYEAGDEPADIRRAVLEIVAHQYTMRTTKKKGAMVTMPAQTQATLVRWWRRPW